MSGPERQKIYIGSDHAGYELKEQIKHYLYSRGAEVVDVGNHRYDAQDDYTDYGYMVAKMVAQEKGALGILFCGSGFGMEVTANKVSGIRATNVCFPGKAKGAKIHNNTNVLSLGARSLTFETAQEIISLWLEESFRHEERHVRRIQKISYVESMNTFASIKKFSSRKKIIPAILEKNFIAFQDKLQILNGKVDWVQIDIMDGKFVPEETFPLKELDTTAVPFLFEVHLMVADPAEYVDLCAKKGICRMIFHIEAVEDSGVRSLIDAIQDKGMEVGIAMSPDTSLEKVYPYADRIDTVLIMGVCPGKSGQSVVEEVFDRVAEVRRNIPRSVRIGVDGGVNTETIEKLIEKGVDHFSVNSAVFQAEDPQAELEYFQNLVRMYPI